MKKLKYSLLISLVMLLSVFVACEEEEDPNPDSQTDIPFRAVVDYTPATPRAGQEITLDASGTLDETGNGFQVLWSIEQQPDGSNSFINDPTQVNTSFLPNEAGDYVIQLIAGDFVEDLLDTTSVSIEVLQRETEEISGTFSEELVLSNINGDSEAPDYLVTGDIYMDAPLTINPGVEIYIEEGNSIFIRTNGSISSNGTAADSVIINSSNAAGGIKWGAIQVESSNSQNALTYTSIKNGGGVEQDFADFADVKTAVGLSDDARLSLSNCSVDGSDGHGIYVRNGELLTFEGNNIKNNSSFGIGIKLSNAGSVVASNTFNNNLAAVELIGSSISDSDVTLPALGGTGTYRVTGDLSVSSVLTVEAGVTAEFNEDLRLEVEQGGALIAIGNASSPITFKSANEAGGIRWKGVEFRSTDSRNELTFVNISYAGNSNFDFADFVDVPAGIALIDDARLKLTESSITNSGGYGLYSRFGEFTDFSNNSFSDNAEAGVGVSITEATKIDGATTFTNNTDAVEVFGSTLDESTAATLTALSNQSAYFVTGQVDIDSDFVIDPGVSMLFGENVKMFVSSTGTIQAIGDASNVITMSSRNASSGIYWTGLEIRSGSALNELQYVQLTYAGGDFMDFQDFADEKTTIGLSRGGTLKLIECTISDSDGHGVYVRRGELPTFSNNVITGNALSAVVGEPNNASSMDGGSDLTGNTGFDGMELYSATLDQNANWAALANGAEYKVTADLIVDADLTLDPGVRIVVDENVAIKVRSAGSLNAVGTAGNNIVMTSSNISSGLLWTGLEFEGSASTLNVLDYVDLSYGGGETVRLDNFEDIAGNVTGDIDAQVTLTNSTISNSGGYGVYWQGAGSINDYQSAGANNTFSNNPSGNQ